jgi:hypothetical protein
MAFSTGIGNEIYFPETFRDIATMAAMAMA